nr:AAA family ATPase [uncultured Albidiferax sp.]
MYTERHPPEAPAANALAASLAQRSALLERVRAELKAELFGIDTVIDRVVESLRAWFLMPHLLNRPVIICLWGLTGTGKTQLTRLLAQKLGFYDRFLEVQMDGFSNGSGRFDNSISGMLADSGIEEAVPGILMLDEFQRYRTIDKDGDDVKVERYQDVWTLLSDGRLAPSLSYIQDLESSLAQSQFDAEHDREDKPAAPKTLHLSPYKAQEFKRSLKLKEPLLEIMRWSPEQIQARLLEVRSQPSAWETDYSRLLIFVAGNLDEMYKSMAHRVEDCDTDADIFHAQTRKLSVIDVKKALGQRFKPEQIARLGNNHVVYPSLDRASYQKLIAVHCQRYLDDIWHSVQIRITLGDCVREEIYANGVFPAQGTRPLLSSLHNILSAPLVNAALWAMESGRDLHRPIHIRLGPDKQQLLLQRGPHSTAFPVQFELHQIKQRANPDFRALLAVHEAGHGLVYGVLFRQAPQEIKINIASFEGGYNRFAGLKAFSKQDCLDMVCVGLAGRAAEQWVFGPDASTTGAEKDFQQATAEAAQFIRHYGFGERLSRTDVSTSADDNLNTEVEPTNQAVEALLQTQMARAHQVLATHASVFVQMVHTLQSQGEMASRQIADLLHLPAAAEIQVHAPYAQVLAAFALQQEHGDSADAINKEAAHAHSISAEG